MGVSEVCSCTHACTCASCMRCGRTSPRARLGLVHVVWQVLTPRTIGPRARSVAGAHAAHNWASCMQCGRCSRRTQRSAHCQRGWRCWRARPSCSSTVRRRSHSWCVMCAGCGSGRLEHIHASRGAGSLCGEAASVCLRSVREGGGGTRKCAGMSQPSID